MDFISNINVWFYIAAYFVGGIPFGLILAKLFANIDIRSQGSKSIGATNVLRVVKEQNPDLAKKLAAATLVLDALKGLAIIIIADLAGVGAPTQWAIAVLAVLGHCFSPFLMFEGGKGVATGLGVLAYLLPLETVVGLAIWFGMAKRLKISSISSLSGLVGLVFASFIIHPDIPHIHTHAPIVIIAIIVVYRHIPNIIRLIQGTEKSAL